MTEVKKNAGPGYAWLHVYGEHFLFHAGVHLDDWWIPGGLCVQVGIVHRVFIGFYFLCGGISFSWYKKDRYEQQ